MASIVTPEGQVTLPKNVLDALGLKPGSAVDFRKTAEGDVVLVAVDQAADGNRFARLRGHAGAGPSTDAIMALTRGEG